MRGPPARGAQGSGGTSRSPKHQSAQTHQRTPCLPGPSSETEKRCLRCSGHKREEQRRNTGSREAKGTDVLKNVRGLLADPPGEHASVVHAAADGKAGRSDVEGSVSGSCRGGMGPQRRRRWRRPCTDGWKARSGLIGNQAPEGGGAER